jgi:hypothetical protein
MAALADCELAATWPGQALVGGSINQIAHKIVVPSLRAPVMARFQSNVATALRQAFFA